MANKSHNRDIYIKIPQGKNTEAENKQYNRNTNMNKKLIRLTEGDLHRIVKESVTRIINESNSLLSELGEICYREGQNRDDFTAHATIRDGQLYLYFRNEKDSPNRQETKTYAKDFIRRNNIFNFGVLDIAGYDQEDKLWVKIFPND